MSVTIAVSVTGDATKQDIVAARWMVSEENARRAATDPPGEVLPTDTNKTLKESYGVCLSQIMISAHESYIQQAQEVEVEKKDLKNQFIDLEDSEKEQVLALMASFKV